MALVGIANLQSASTGATIEIVRFIPPPAEWYGTANAQGFSGILGSVPKTGLAHAEGFAPNIIRAFDVAPLFGSINAQGFAPVVGDEFYATALLGTANLEGKLVVVDWVVEGEVVANVLLGEARLEGFKPSTSGVPLTPELGIVRVEGFAPNVTAGKIIEPTVGVINAAAQGTTADVEKVRIIDGPFVGEARAEGPLQGVVRVGPDVTFPALGQASAEGAVATITLQRTSRPLVGQIRLEGFVQSVTVPTETIFTPLVGVVNVQGFSGIVTTGRWSPVGGNTSSWTPTDPEGQRWNAVSQDSSTWTPVDEAV